MLRHLSRGRSGRQNKSNGQPQITGDLQQMLDRIVAESGHSPDIVIRHLKIGGPVPTPVKAAIVYLNALSNQQMINNFVIKPLMELDPERVNAYPTDRLMKYILEDALTLGETSVVNEWNDIMMAVLSGDTVLLVDGSD
ncbi:spore germination protein, partial [Salmonella enterica subsp. enterica]|nr:spore germination protein [Salmonella enterica subsp. enterica]